jgi:hypothetical protein
MASSPLSLLTPDELEAQRDSISDQRHLLNTQYLALTVEMMVRQIAVLAPQARYLELRHNPNYENGTFWELTDVFNADGDPLFDLDPQPPFQADPVLQDLIDLFSDDFSGDYTDGFGLMVGPYFDLSTREPREEIPALAPVSKRVQGRTL